MRTHANLEVATTAEASSLPLSKPAAISYTQSKYRPDIDGMRAFAVLSVIAFHAFPNFIKGGFIGVDIFFVISGYLISGIIFNHLSHDDFSFSDFYYRRIKRIFPSLLLVLVFSLAFGWYVLTTDEYRRLGEQVAGGAGFVANIVLWHESGYFDSSAASKPLLHLWSLGVEEQFYIMWPLLLYAAYKRKFNWLLLIAGLSAVSFLLNVVFVKDYPVASYYLPFTRFWELLLGAFLAYLHLNPNYHLESSGRLSQLSSLLGAILLAVSLLSINNALPFPGWWALLPTLGTFLIILAGKNACINKWFLSHPAAVWIGLISYPLYLWHWPLLSFMYIIAGPHPSHVLRIAIILLSIGLAWLSYVLLEKRIRFNTGAAVIPALSFGSVLILAAGLTVSQGGLEPRLTDPALSKLLSAVNDWNFPPAGFSNFEYDSQDYYIKKTGAEKVLFIGDSNMEQYGTRIDKVLSEQPLQSKTAIFATTGGCPPIVNVSVKEHPDCQPRLKSAYKLALSADIDTVVIAGCWYCYFVRAEEPDATMDYYYESNGVRNYFRNDKGAVLALAEFEKNLKVIASKKKVYLVLNAPAGDTLDPVAFAPGTRLSPQVQFTPPTDLSLNEFEHEYAPVRQALKAIALRAGAAVIDPLISLCKGGVCPAMTEQGFPIYKDSIHISAYYAENFVNYLDQTVLIPPAACLYKVCTVMSEKTINTQQASQN